MQSPSQQKEQRLILYPGIFAPHGGVDEDPVTGSSHTRLAPLWGEKLEKQNSSPNNSLIVVAWLLVKLREKELKISGQAVLEQENIVIHNDDI